MADVYQAKVNTGPDGSKEDEDGEEVGTDVDGPANNTLDFVMDIESPSSELEKLVSEANDNTESDNDSMASGNEGIYVVNPDTSADSDKKTDNGKTGDDVNINIGRADSVDSKEPAEKKMKHDRRLTDSFLIEKKSSDGKLNDSLTGSRPSSVASSGKSGKEKDPLKKEKDREREDRIRQAQVKLAEERHRKIEEMREQQRAAQENREKQLEARRKKIEDLKRREEDRRKQVDERRRTQEEIDKVKKEAILSKAKERLTRYEQWKSHGRKGYPGESPPSKKLSMSTSVLYHKRSPDFSSTGALNTKGTGGLKSGAESMIALHAIPENRLGRSFVASKPPTRHKSSVNLGMTAPVVKMRDPSKTSPRKPRPSSVATSMPSFVRVEIESPKSSRSKSTDRGPRERSKTRQPGRKEEDKTDGKENKKAATLPRPYDRKKIEERRQEVKKKAEEKKEKEKEARERMSKSEIRDEPKEKIPSRMTKSFIERMSVPKRPSPEKKVSPMKESTPVKVIKRHVLVEAPVASPKAKPSSSKPKVPKESPLQSAATKDDSSESKSEVSKSDSIKSDSPVPLGTPPARHTPTIQVEEFKDEADHKGESPAPTDDQPRDLTPEPTVTVTFAEPETPKTPPRAKPDVKQTTPEPKSAPKSAETKTTPKTDKEREMEEYKAKLAERRRFAREKAEREAEIERLKQEELQRQQEEQERLEEERQRREEEESLRLASEARQAEEERLQKAIEAEEKRKREEAEKFEQDRIAREEADKKAKEEAERVEKEREERAKREEEERVERKKRLEMIMKRVKTDSPASTPEKSRTESPTRVITSSSSRTSLVSSEDERTDETDRDERGDRSDSADDTPKFKSPLLQKLTETKALSADSGTPKFKSPLLQSIMGKTKLGARLSGTKLDEMSKSDDNLSTKSDDNLSVKSDNESENLSDKESAQDDTEQNNNKDTLASGLTNGLSGDKCETSENLLKDEDNLTSRADVDLHEVGQTVIDTNSKDAKVSDNAVSDENTLVTDSQTTVSSTADSAVSLTFNGVSSHNGDLHIEPRELIDSKELVDSSISMRTADSFGSSQTGSMGESLVESQTLQTSDSSQFEEIIDLSVTNKTLRSQQIADNFLNHSDDVLNLNNLDNIDNTCMSGGGDASSSHPLGKPIIAFEDNATRRQDVPGVYDGDMFIMCLTGPDLRRLAEISDKTSCHEDSIDVNASMVTTDLSSNQHSDVVVMDNHEAVGASQHSPSVNNTRKSNMDFKYVSTSSHHHRPKTKFNSESMSGMDQMSQNGQSLHEDPEISANMDNLWGDVEGVMGVKQGEVCRVLEVYGIGEGEEDSETEEGQLWRMVQGDAPYTLNLV